MTKTEHYAVFGHPISHSKSPRIHGLFAEQTRQRIYYAAQDVAADAFKAAADAFFADGGKGLNCTVPLKELAWQYAGRLSERARKSKAVNTLALQADGGIWGDNTDGIGLLNDLTLNHGINLLDSRILILGAGGATRGILAPLLEQHPACIAIANRTLEKAETIVNEFADAKLSCCDYAGLAGRQFDLIVNATSASLGGQLPPLTDDLLAASGCCYDLAYGNQATTFVRWGMARHARKSLDGLGMLVEQAAEAFALWRGIRPDTAPVIALLNRERQIPNSFS
ncbi:shikimate dehydrogenase [Methylomonas sp. SURF-2]|uniref:Shikimate dehydrogenase (NADP(+)) n=1 Tax=Methylomonas subterranea TaxID=2952225 RepID=A0ABT1TF13_9GAMM|nr:shikimate dehydrogenase [Methylomonas sp. SURF-2]